MIWHFQRQTKSSLYSIPSRLSHCSVSSDFVWSGRLHSIFYWSLWTYLRLLARAIFDITLVLHVSTALWNGLGWLLLRITWRRLDWAGICDLLQCRLAVVSRWRKLKILGSFFHWDGRAWNWLGVGWEIVKNVKCISGVLQGKPTYLHPLSTRTSPLSSDAPNASY